MKKRDTESYTTFSERIKEECTLYDLQGLCSDRWGNYTIAVEAIDMENDRVRDYEKCFDIETLCAKTRLAEALGVRLALLLHKRMEEKDLIYVKIFSLKESHQELTLEYDKRLTEEYFIKWWKKRQPCSQKKAYGDKMTKILAESYFDCLLKNNNSSWSGNIDAFTVKRDENGHIQITSLIEFRYTSEGPVSDYDPNHFFDRDIKIWNSLWNISRVLNVPLYLITFSRELGYDEALGVTEIVGLDQEKGLVYKDAKKPCDRIFYSGGQLLEWMAAQR